MLHSEGQIATPEASRFLQRLCFHFSRKISVSYDEHQGQAHFPTGFCQMKASPDTLYFSCSAASEDALQRVQLTLDHHVQLFSRKSPLIVEWSRQTVIS
ncbi:DUF2218 domain-containing protein [Comamonas aquatica]|uniref:DUF2218 domain-containing protein n=1 Tax=Comamonas aquatica TaxID=225991 RepID=UPI001F40592D|nr:DUF2218 domain-containing protein [Comamonas aquatica]